ncbi:MAG TPA: glycosyltransferase family 9 protein [Candidatus Eisenbacteria bacterium]|nr:glycosyltransferase family 9 protein [Candidatus Eisenbacteria bacterium]
MAPRARAADAGDPRRIAVLRLSSLGDVILTLPCVQALRAAYPAAEIAYWTKEEYAGVVRHEPALTRVRALEKDARRVEDLVSMSAELEDSDLIVDLHASLRTRVLTFRQQARVLRVKTRRLQRSRWVHARWTEPAPLPHALERYAATLAPLGIAVDGVPAVHVDEVSERWAADWLAWAGAAPIALCPGTAHFTKRWPERHWLALHDRLRAAGVPLVYFGLKREFDDVPALRQRIADDPAGARMCSEPLPRIAAAMALCRAAVSSDSGLMHLAAARGLRVVAMFGSTAPELGFAPAGDGHVVLCRHEKCQPCTLHGREECPLKHFRCMELLEPETVWEGLRQVGAVSG